MKEKVAAAGIRTPKHKSAKSAQGVRAAVKKIGYPVIIKPIAGAGSMDTIGSTTQRSSRPLSQSSVTSIEVNVEEFIDGEEYTYDTICIDGKIAVQEHRLLSSASADCAKRGVDQPADSVSARSRRAGAAGGHEMGHAVIEALNMKTGFTHMEWYRKSDGEVVFGEIAARPAGARTVDLMNFVSDIDLFRGYAEAEVHGRFSQIA